MTNNFKFHIFVKWVYVLYVKIKGVLNFKLLHFDSHSNIFNAVVFGNNL